MDLWCTDRVMVSADRVVNPAVPEAMMLAILFATSLLPDLNHFVVQPISSGACTPFQ